MIRLAHEVLGTGIPVVLLHAFPLSHTMWKGQMNSLQRMVQVIAPDLPGLGRSPRQTQPSIPDMAQEVVSLLDHLGVKEPVVVAGLSMGGYVAFEFLRQNPKRVRGLGLFSTRALADTAEGRENRLKSAQKIRSEGLERFSTTILPKLLGTTTMESHLPVIQEVTAMILANCSDGVADALLAMAQRRDSTELLNAIRCPTLVVAGDEDTFIPLSEAKKMQAEIPHARCEVIEKAGHLLNLEQPVVFQKILEEFLGSTIGAHRSS